MNNVKKAEEFLKANNYKVGKDDLEKISEHHFAFDGRSAILAFAKSLDSEAEENKEESND